jgi:TonB family protein
MGRAAVSTGILSAPVPGATPRQRRVPRYKLTVPLDLTVLRAGVPGTIAGRSLEIGEGGMGVVPATQLVVGESVRVEFLIPHSNTPVRATAVVRYQRGGSFGLEFLRLPSEQQSIIRYWTRREGELLLASKSGRAPAPVETLLQPAPEPILLQPEKLKDRRWFGPLAGTALAFFLLMGGLAWWQWEQGWREIEADLIPAGLAETHPETKVNPEAMERLVVHKVVPEYPDSARKSGVQGAVVLNAVVNEAGTVSDLTVVSGPDVLGQAALDAVRWWRYQPYRVNGRAVPVETTVIVNFRLTN